MTDTMGKIAPNHAAACPPPSRSRVAARALAAAVLVLIVACGEVKLIEQAAASALSCGIGARDGLIRVVDNSLTSGFAPIALLR